MSTASPKIYIGEFPTISNPIKIALFAASDLNAEIASQTFSAPHPRRGVTFPGLERVNYVCRIYEMSGGVPLRTLVNDFNFNPDNQDLKYRDSEIIICGITTGFTAGANSFTFDGTGGKPDWRTWKPILQPPGFSPWLQGYNYTWDSVTGTLTMIDGQTFESEFRILAQFETIVNNGATGGVATGRQFSEVLEITTSTTLTPADFGKKIIINPSSTYIKITMPVIANVVQNKTIFFETGIEGASPFCVEIEAQTGTQWAYGKAGRTSMFMVANETFTAYRYGSNWRVQDAVGNFKNVGEQTASDDDTMLGAILLAGQVLGVNQYKRLYNEFVMNLPSTQVVAYASWSSNQTKWSYADANGNFRCPDRRNMHERNANDTNAPGKYLAPLVGPHTHFMFGQNLSGNADVTALTGASRGYSDGGNLGYRITKSIGEASLGLTSNGGNSENFVSSYFINRFVKI